MGLKKVLVGLVLAAAMTVLPRVAQASTITIDFDSYANGTTLPVGTFDGLGVHFNDTLSICGGTCGDLSSSAPNTAVNGVNFGGDITGSFLSPVSFVSVFAGDVCCDVDTVTLNVYNSLNVMIGTATFSGESAQTLSVSASGITRFEILQVGAIAIDDFTFGSNDAAAVPEPGTLLLLGTGLAAVGVRRRLKRQA